MNKFRHLTILLLLTVCAGSAAGQTDYSLRLRSLGVDLAGLVADPISDAYLNPARLAVFEKTELYAARHPGRTIEADFPVFYDIRYMNSIDESYIISSGSDPLVFNLILPAGGKTVLSFGAWLDVNGDDDMDSDTYYEVPDRYHSNLIGWGDSSWENTADAKHLLFDAAAVRTGDTSLGIRLTAKYDLYNHGYLRMNNDNHMDIATQSEISTYQYYFIRNPKLEVSDLSLSTGLYNPDLFITDVKLGFGLVRQQINSATGTFTLHHDDVDGNGWDPRGDPADFYIYELDQYNSNRDYLAYKVFSRIQLQSTEKLKSILSAFYEWSDGDGGAVYKTIDVVEDRVYEEDTRKRLNYFYNGSTRKLDLQASIGFTDEIHDGVLVAVGLKGVFGWNRFEEDGPGEASYYQTSSTAPGDTLAVSSDYFQRYDLKRITYGLVIPVACEWKVQKYVTLRLGSRFGAVRTDDDREHQSSISDFTFPMSGQDTFNDIDRRIWYETYFKISNGLEVNIDDRFIVELSSGSSSYRLDLAYYSYFSFRYRF